tara:strand:+ start:132 stop:1355 length:1224 start_codon:yes stop_codon:yes gene_type:complete
VKVGVQDETPLPTIKPSRLTPISLRAIPRAVEEDEVNDVEENEVAAAMLSPLARAHLAVVQAELVEAQATESLASQLVEAQATASLVALSPTERESRVESASNAHTLLEAPMLDDAIPFTIDHHTPAGEVRERSPLRRSPQRSLYESMYEHLEQEKEQHEVEDEQERERERERAQWQSEVDLPLFPAALQRRAPTPSMAVIDTTELWSQLNEMTAKVADIDDRRGRPQFISSLATEKMDEHEYDDLRVRMRDSVEIGSLHSASAVEAEQVSLGLRARQLVAAAQRSAEAARTQERPSQRVDREQVANDARARNEAQARIGREQERVEREQNARSRIAEQARRIAAQRALKASRRRGTRTSEVAYPDPPLEPRRPSRAPPTHRRMDDAAMSWADAEKARNELLIAERR